jgi:hypothetical protein
MLVNIRKFTGFPNCRLDETRSGLRVVVAEA